jgi:hypothetical protein
MRLTPLGWVLLAAAVAAALLALISPGAALVAAVILALVLLAVLAEGMAVPGGRFDMGVAAARKREVLTRFFKRGRPEWETTAPDFPDEPPDMIFERERKRRGLG